MALTGKVWGFEVVHQVKPDAPRVYQLEDFESPPTVEPLCELDHEDRSYVLGSLSLHPSVQGEVGKFLAIFSCEPGSGGYSGSTQIPEDLRLSFRVDGKELPLLSGLTGREVRMVRTRRFGVLDHLTHERFVLREFLIELLWRLSEAGLFPELTPEVRTYLGADLPAPP